MKDTTAWPLVTIITPAYNRANLLAETIESVLGQDYPNLEHLVLDDGSTDGTADVLARYAGRVRVEWHPNMGETRTVNRGFALARGDVIGVVSSDDPLLPGAIRHIVETLRARPEVLVAYPDWRMIDAVGNPMRDERTYDYDYVDMVRRHHCVPGPGTLFRRSVADRLGGRDPAFRYVADFDFWLRAGLLGPFVRVPEILATFRVHGDSASVNQKHESMAEEHVRLVEKFFELADVPAEVRAIRAEAVSSAYYVAGVVCGDTPSWKRARLFASALRHAPLKYVGEHRRRVLDMVYHVTRL